MTLAIRRNQGDEGSLPFVLASPGETQAVNWVVGSTTSLRNDEKGRAKGAEKQPAEEWCQPPVHWQQWDAAAEEDQVKPRRAGRRAPRREGWRAPRNDWIRLLFRLQGRKAWWRWGLLERLNHLGLLDLFTSLGLKLRHVKSILIAVYHM
jgi:hypothetical protein